MSKKITVVKDCISGYTHSVIVHDDSSIDFFGATKGAQRWAQWASENAKTLDDAVESLAANFVTDTPVVFSTKSVLALRNTLQRENYLKLLHTVSDDLLAEEDFGQTKSRHVISNRVRAQNGQRPSVIFQPLSDFSPEDRAAVAQFKVNHYYTQQKMSTLELQVKGVRAVFDRDIGPGGGWRCPDGTMYGGRITDRFGRGCGGSLTRRIGRAIMRAGQQAGETARDTRRLQRAAERGQRQVARQTRREARRIRRRARTEAEIARRRRAARDLVELLVGDYDPGRGTGGAVDDLRFVAEMLLRERNRQKRRRAGDTRRRRGEPSRWDDARRAAEVWERFQRRRRELEEEMRRRDEAPSDRPRPRRDETVDMGNDVILPPPRRDDRTDVDAPRADADRRRRDDQTDVEETFDLGNDAIPRTVEAPSERTTEDIINDIQDVRRQLRQMDRDYERRRDRGENIDLSFGRRRQLLQDRLGALQLERSAAEDRERRDLPEANFLMGGGRRTPSQGGRAARRGVEPRAVQRDNRTGRRRDLGINEQMEIAANLSDEALLDEIESAEELLNNPDSLINTNEFQDTLQRYPLLLTVAADRGLVDRQLRDRPEPGTPRRSRVGAEAERQEGWRGRARAAIGRAVDRLVGDYQPAADGRPARGGRRRGTERDERVDEIIDRVSDTARDLLRDRDGRSRGGRTSENRRDRRARNGDEATDELQRRIDRELRRGLDLPEKDPDAAPGDANEDREIEDVAGEIARDIVEAEGGLPTPREGERIIDGPGTPEEIARTRRQRPGRRPPAGPAARRQREGIPDRVEAEDVDAPRADVPEAPRDAPEAERQVLINGRDAFRDMADEDFADMGDRELRQLVDAYDDADFGALSTAQRERYLNNLARLAYERERRRRDPDRAPVEVSTADVTDANVTFGSEGLPFRPYWRDRDFGADFPDSAARQRRRDAYESRWGRFYDGDGPNAQLTREGDEVRGRSLARHQIRDEKLRSSPSRRVSSRPTEEVVAERQAKRRRARDLDINRELAPQDVEDFGLGELYSIESRIMDQDDDRLADNLTLVQERINELVDRGDEVGPRTPPELIEAGREKLESPSRPDLPDGGEDRSSRIGLNDVEGDDVHIDTDPDFAEEFAYIDDAIDSRRWDDILAVAMRESDDDSPTLLQRWAQNMDEEFMRAISEGDLNRLDQILQRYAYLSRNSTEPPTRQEAAASNAAQVNRAKMRIQEALVSGGMRRRATQNDLLGWATLPDEDRKRALAGWMDYHGRLRDRVNSLNFGTDLNEENLPDAVSLDGRSLAQIPRIREMDLDAAFEERFGFNRATYGEIVRDRDGFLREIGDITDDVDAWLRGDNDAPTLTDISNRYRALSQMAQRLNAHLYHGDKSGQLGPAIDRMLADVTWAEPQAFAARAVPGAPTLEEFDELWLDINDAMNDVDFYLNASTENILRMSDVELNNFIANIDAIGNGFAPNPARERVNDERIRRFANQIARSIRDNNPSENNRAEKLARVQRAIAERRQGGILATRDVPGQPLPPVPAGVPNMPDNLPDVDDDVRQRLTDKLRNVWARRRRSAVSGQRDYDGNPLDPDDLPWDNSSFNRGARDAFSDLDPGNWLDEPYEVDEPDLDDYTDDKGNWLDPDSEQQYNVALEEFEIYQQELMAWEDQQSRIQGAEGALRDWADDVFNFSYVAPDGRAFRVELEDVSVGSGYTGGELEVNGRIMASDGQGSFIRVGNFTRRFNPSENRVMMDLLRINLHDLENGEILQRTKRSVNGEGRYIDTYSNSAPELRNLGVISEDVYQAIAMMDNGQDMRQKIHDLPEGFRVYIDEFGGKSVMPPTNRPLSRGGGLATAFNYRVWNFAQGAGFTDAEVHAGFVDGPYVWGRFGYRTESSSDVTSMWQRARDQLQDFRAGNDSIIKTEEQAQLIEALADESLSEGIYGPQYLELIYALEFGDSSEDRKQAVRAWMQNNAEFSEGIWTFDERQQIGGEDFINPDEVAAVLTNENKLHKKFKLNGSGPEPQSDHPTMAGGLSEVGPSQASYPAAFVNPDITDENAAADHVRAGGSLSEVPNEYWGWAIRNNSSTRETDTNNTFYYRTIEQPGAMGTVEIYLVRDENGRPTGQGYVMKRSQGASLTGDQGEPYQIDSIGDEVLGYNVLAALGLSPDGATWDGVDGAGQPVAVVPYAPNAAAAGEEVTRGARNFDRAHLDQAEDRGVNARVQALVASWLMNMGDRHDGNALGYIFTPPATQATVDNPNPPPPVPRAVVMPIDFGRTYTTWWANNAGMDPGDDMFQRLVGNREGSSLAHYLNEVYTLMDMELPTTMREVYDDLVSRRGVAAAEEYRQEVLSTVRQLLDRADALRAAGRESWIDMARRNMPANAVLPYGFNDWDQYWDYIGSKYDMFVEQLKGGADALEEVKNWFTQGRRIGVTS